MIRAMRTCTVRLSFHVASRLMRHAGRCAQLHGYRHLAEITFSSADPNSDMVADFGMLRETLGGWIMERWDHNVILNIEDRKLGAAIEAETGQSVFYFPGDPTAENLAEYLMEDVCPALFPPEVHCIRVRLYDSEDAFVEVTSE